MNTARSNFARVAGSHAADAVDGGRCDGIPPEKIADIVKTRNRHLSHVRMEDIVAVVKEKLCDLAKGRDAANKDESRRKKIATYAVFHHLMDKDPAEDLG